MVLSFPLASPNHAIATSMKQPYMGVIRNRKSVPERSKTDSKSVELATVPRVRIPDSPPYLKSLFNSISYKGFCFSIVPTICTHFTTDISAA